MSTRATGPKPTLRARDDALTELMDDPGCDPERLRATLRRFGVVNRVVSGWGRVYRTRLRRALAAQRASGVPARVLDLGCGGGDVIARLAACAARDGFDVRWTGADPDERALDVARARGIPYATYTRADADELVARGDAYDIVVSNHVLHHLGGPDGVAAFAAASAQLATRLVLHGDIARSRTAYGLYAVGVTPLSAGTFLRTDGLRSIRRSYRAAELADALGAGWTIDQPVPFRLLAAAPGRAG